MHRPFGSIYSSLVYILEKKTDISRVSSFATLNFRAREALRQCLPDQLKDSTFANCLKDDNSTKRWLMQLQQNLEAPGVPDPRSMPLHQQ